MDGWLTERAEQMVPLAGVAQSFRHGCSLLQELAGWSACHEVVRQACYRQADERTRQREAGWAEVEPLGQAQGQREFQVDATKLNTVLGWRDIQVAVSIKRLAGQLATAEQWDKRALPAATARLAFAAIEEIDGFAQRGWPWAARKGLGGGRLNVDGDGAEWIGQHAEEPFAHWRGTLDIFHASEHLADAAKAGGGEGTEEAARWRKEARLALLRDGYRGLCDSVQSSAAWVPDRRALEEATPGLLNDLCGHRERLNDALRLHRGEPIGSGLIEGACKQLIGRRRKQTGAQWTVANADRMALLCSLAYADALPLSFNAA